MSDSPSHVDDQLSLDRYFAAIWRAKWLIILLTLCAAGVAWFVARRQPATHTAAALVEVGRVWKEPIEDPYVTKEMVNGSTFLRELAEKIGAKPNVVRRSVRAEVVEGGVKERTLELIRKYEPIEEDAQKHWEDIKEGRVLIVVTPERFQWRYDD